MSIEKITLLQSIGKFEGISPGEHVPFKHFTVVHAENGSGKTTLSTVFKSLSKGDSSYIMDRKRVTSVDDPRIILNVAGDEFTFANRVWSNTYPNIHVFDDIYVAENVYSGIEIEVSHRRNMHSFIIGEKGVELYNKYLEARKEAEMQKETIDAKGQAISSQLRGGFTVEEFCNLSEIQDIDEQIANVAQTLTLARSSEAICNRNEFVIPNLPEFDVGNINQILNKSLTNVQADTSQRVKEHFAMLGPGGEEWVAEGIPYMNKISTEGVIDKCPFCYQNLSSPNMIHYYQHYFSQAYRDLKDEIAHAGNHITNLHSDQSIMNFETFVKDIHETHNFWRNYISMPSLNIDVSIIKNAWIAAREQVINALRMKIGAPLDPIILSQNTLNAISIYDSQRNWFLQLSLNLNTANSEIRNVKNTTIHSDVNALERMLAKLQANKARFSPAIAQMCNEYNAEVRKLAVIENTRDTIRSDLNRYRKEIFPQYQESINNYLREFGAGFQIGSVSPVNDRGGSSVRYSIIIDNSEIPLNSDSGPSFCNTLSAGDRSTLAFAFFLTMLNGDENKKEKIVIIDDPVTSLDQSRMSMTREAIRNLIFKTRQVIVLSHSKPFLHNLWSEVQRSIERSKRDELCSAIQISRGKSGSHIEMWSVSSDDSTTYERSYKLIQRYIREPASTKGQKMEVGSALRFVLEGYLRTVFPEHFVSGMFLGKFVSLCRKYLDEGNTSLLSEKDTTELRQLKDYSNRFHHGSNCLQDVTEQELLEYSKRTLAFCSKN